MILFASFSPNGLCTVILDNEGTVVMSVVVIDESPLSSKGRGDKRNAPSLFFIPVDFYIVCKDRRV